MATFSEIFKALRKDKQLTPEQVAELCNIKNVTSIKWTNYAFHQVMRLSALTDGTSVRSR